MKKKIISVLLASMMVIGLVGCGGSKETADGAKSDSGDGLIKVGIINNDPNESGYRTANDKDLKATFTKENGYDASFAYSLKNDEQITSAQKFIQDGVDYLLLSAADTAGWDSVLKDAQDAVHRLFCSTVQLMQTKACMQHLSYPTWKKKVRQQQTG